MTREILQPTSVHSTAGIGYSHAAIVGDTLYIAGQIALDRSGRLVGKDDIELQAQQVYANLAAILSELGGDLGDIVKMTTFLTERSHLDGFRRARNRVFSEPFPPNTLLLIDGLAHPDYLIEIEAVAVLPSSRNDQADSGGARS